MFVLADEVWFALIASLLALDGIVGRIHIGVQVGVCLGRSGLVTSITCIEGSLVVDESLLVKCLDGGIGLRETHSVARLIAQ